MKKKSLGKIALTALLAIIVVFGSSIAVLWIFFPPEKIKTMAIPEVEKALGRKVQIQKAGISIFPVFGVTVSGVEISNTVRPGFSSEPFVRLEKLKIQISLFSLLKGHPTISKIILNKPQVRIEADQSGSFNFDDVPGVAGGDTAVKKEKKTGGMPMLPVPVTLKKLVIKDGSLVYINDKDDQELTIGNIDQTIGFSIDKELKNIKTNGLLKLSNVSVKTKEIKKPLADLSISLSHDIGADLINGKAQVKQLRLSFQKISVNMTGTIEGLNSTPSFNLAVQSDSIFIKDILSEIPPELVPVVEKLTGSGTADLLVHLNGEFKDGKVPVQGELKVDNATIKHSDLPKSINGLNIDIAFTDNSVDVRDLRMLFGESPIQLKAKIDDLKKPTVNLTLLADLNLTDLKNAVELPKGASFDGKVKADISANGQADPSDPSKLNVKGTVDLKNVSILWPPIAKPAVMNGLFRLSSKAIGEDISVSIGKSSLNMSAEIANYLSLVFPDSTKTLPRPSVDFKMVSSYLNFDEIMPPEKKTEKVAVQKNKPGTKQTQTAPLIAPIPGVDMKGTVIARKIVYKGVEMNNMNMKINSVNDIANIGINTGFSGGTIIENVNANMKKNGSVAFTNKLNVSNIEVDKLISNFKGFVDPSDPLSKTIRDLDNSLFGKINLKSEISGNGATSEDITRTLHGNISAKVNDGKISNSLVLKKIAGVLDKFIKIGDIRFNELSTDIKIADERLFFNTLKVQSDVGDWDAKGSMGFNQSLAMDLSNRLSKSISNDILGVQNGGKNVIKGLLNAAQLGGATSFIDNIGIPADKDGRVTLKIKLAGTTSDPRASFAGFESNKNSQSNAQASSKPSVKEQIQQNINQKKQDLEKNLQSEKSAVANQAKQKTNQLTKKLKKLF